MVCTRKKENNNKKMYAKTIHKIYQPKLKALMFCNGRV